MTKFRGISKDEVLKIGEDIGAHNFVIYLKRCGYNICDEHGNVIDIDGLRERYKNWARVL